MYTGLDMNAVHIAVNTEKFHVKNMSNVAFRIPCIMPLIASGKPKDATAKLSKSNIANRKKDDIALSSQIATCNYIRMTVPKYLRFGIPTDGSLMVPEGTKFLVIFVEGNPHNPQIIGRAY